MTSETLGGPTEVTTPNYLVRLFRGDIPLVITYWVWGVLIGSVLVRIGMELIERNIVSLAGTASGPFLVMVFAVLAVALTLFVMVAIWRSAGNYQGRPAWARLARFAVFLGGLALVRELLFVLADDGSSRRALQEEVALMNKSLPVMTDEYTRFDSASLVDDRLGYHFTLVNEVADQLDLEYLHESMRTELVAEQCADPDERKLLDSGIQYVFEYRDSEGAQLASIKVGKEDCQ